LLSENPTGGMSFHQMTAKVQSPNFHQLFCWNVRVHCYTNYI